MAAEWPIIKATTSTTQDEFVDYAVERWAQALRDRVSLGLSDLIFPVFVWGLIQVLVTNDAGWPNWWQTLPFSISGAALITVGWRWLRRRGYVEWED